MLCAAIKGPSFEQAYEQIKKAILYVDLIELRLDLFEKWDISSLKSLCAHFSIPMIFTLKRSLQSEERWLSDIRSVAELKPAYLDLEHPLSPTTSQEIKARFPETQLILSFHDFVNTPKDLQALYLEMQKTPASFYKIAATAHSSLDALRLLHWAKKATPKPIAISMGEEGQISRILSPIFGIPITYASVEDKTMTAPGQISAKILTERYHYPSLNSQTAIYGLIGDPVTQSISDETHNPFLKACGFNAVYVKMRVKEPDLEEFLHLAQKLSFKGLSVTMPLKEKIIPYLQEIDPQAKEIGAVNTLLFERGHIIGLNTDSLGALNAIEKKGPIKNKQIALLGAGGAAKAIAYEAKRRGATLTILNRDLRKAQELAKKLSCQAKRLEEIEKIKYDLLINTTPLSICPLPKTQVMDIVTKPKETKCLKQAKEKECTLIYGYEMFIEQAVLQFEHWFKEEMGNKKSILESKVTETLNYF